MKNLSRLALVQALLSTISGVLISKMSLIGRVGVSLAYREYTIFKTWWKTALLLFAIQVVLIVILQVVRSKTGAALGRLVALLLLVVGFIGAYLTYDDFTNTSHKVMKASFHFGFYLFWAAWAITCLYFLFFHRKGESNSKHLAAPSETSTNEPPLITSE